MITALFFGGTLAPSSQYLGREYLMKGRSLRLVVF
jgi:hypothetical protein